QPECFIQPAPLSSLLRNLPEMCLQLGRMLFKRFFYLPAVDAFWRLPLLDGIAHALEQIEIVLVAIGLKIKVGGNLAQALVADSLDVFLHEAVIVAPAQPGSAHGRLFGARSNLVRMQIMQPELIDQRLFHLFMQDQEAIGIHVATFDLQSARHMAIDVDSLPVDAVTREVRDIVIAIELLDSPHNGVERAVEHQVGNVQLWKSQFLMRRFGMAKLKRHDVVSFSGIGRIAIPGERVQRSRTWKLWNDWFAMEVCVVARGAAHMVRRTQRRMAACPQYPSKKNASWRRSMSSAKMRKWSNSGRMPWAALRNRRRTIPRGRNTGWKGGWERAQTGPDEPIHPAFWRSGITARLPLKFHKKQLLTG